MSWSPHKPLDEDKVAFPKLMRRIGIWIEDTDFNRRAAEYAKWSRWAEQYKRQQARAKGEKDESA